MNKDYVGHCEERCKTGNYLGFNTDMVIGCQFLSVKSLLFFTKYTGFYT